MLYLLLFMTLLGHGLCSFGMDDTTDPKSTYSFPIQPKWGLIGGNDYSLDDETLNLSTRFEISRTQIKDRRKRNSVLIFLNKVISNPSSTPVEQIEALLIMMTINHKKIVEGKIFELMRDPRISLENPDLWFQAASSIMNYKYLLKPTRKTLNQEFLLPLIQKPTKNILDRIKAAGIIAKSDEPKEGILFLHDLIRNIDSSPEIKVFIAMKLLQYEQKNPYISGELKIFLLREITPLLDQISPASRISILGQFIKSKNVDDRQDAAKSLVDLSKNADIDPYLRMISAEKVLEQKHVSQSLKNQAWKNLFQLLEDDTTTPPQLFLHVCEALLTYGPKTERRNILEKSLKLLESDDKRWAINGAIFIIKQKKIKDIDDIKEKAISFILDFASEKDSPINLRELALRQLSTYGPRSLKSEIEKMLYSLREE